MNLRPITYVLATAFLAIGALACKQNTTTNTNASAQPAKSECPAVKCEGEAMKCESEKGVSVNASATEAKKGSCEAKKACCDTPKVSPN